MPFLIAAGVVESYSHFPPWLDHSKSVRSNQKSDCSTEFSLVVDERARNNLCARWSELTWSDLTVKQNTKCPVVCNFFLQNVCCFHAQNLIDDI